MTEAHPESPGPADDAPAKQHHGDPLLASAQGRGDGEDATRHGHGEPTTDEPADD